MSKKKLFRNKIEIRGIEPYSLWELVNEAFILCDDDNFIAVPASENMDNFYEVTGK